LNLKVFFPRSTFRIKDVRITSVPVLHSVKAPNVALFLDFPGGIRICYATDVLALRKADRDRFLRGTLLYIGDGASLKRTLARIAQGTDVPIGHQSIEGQIAWAREAGVKHFVFTHFGEWALKLDERSLKRELEERGAIAAHDGMKVTVSKRRFLVKTKRRTFVTDAKLKPGTVVKQAKRHKFYLFRHWFKARIVTRFGPSKQHFDLRIDESKPDLFNFVLERNPITQKTLTGYFKPHKRDAKVRLARWVRMTEYPGKTVRQLDITDKVGLASNQPANPFKMTPAWYELLDKGDALLLEERPGYRLYELRGRKLRGLWEFDRRRNEIFWDIRHKGHAVRRGLSLSFHAPIFKQVPAEQLVFGVVLEPDTFDLAPHIISPEEIQQALHEYVAVYRQIGVDHKRLLPNSYPVEAYIAPVDFEVDGEKIKKGSAVLGAKVVEQDVWQRVLKGDLTGFSIQGYARYIPVRRDWYTVDKDQIIQGRAYRLVDLTFYRVDLVRMPSTGKVFFLVKQL